MNLQKVKIQAYTGYGNKNKIVCRGRILIDKDTASADEDTILNDIIKSYRRAESDEISSQVFQVKFGDVSKEFKTNSEGFFYLKQKIETLTAPKNFENIRFSILKEHKKDTWEKDRIHSIGKIMFPDENAEFGIVSDIDDTILKTDVMSPFKWKIFYNTLFVKASKRLPIWDANTWYKKLKNGTKKSNNPFFYVSHSPWNLYLYLNEFLRLNHFPEGPVLLRDFGRNKNDKLQSYSKHKTDEIESILKMYPKLPLVLIGDGGEKDAHFYLAIKEKYPKKIKAIFIRRLGDAKHQARIEKLAKGHEDYFFFIKTAKQGIKISKELGLISKDQ